MINLFGELSPFTITILLTLPEVYVIDIHVLFNNNTPIIYNIVVTWLV